MTIQQICQLSEEVRTGELLEAVFIDQAIKDPDSKEADTNFVLRATYPTVALRGLVELMVQKLSSEYPKGTVVIREDYGSGKSHALLALYHVASLGSEAQGGLTNGTYTAASLSTPTWPCVAGTMRKYTSLMRLALNGV